MTPHPRRVAAAADQIDRILKHAPTSDGPGGFVLRVDPDAPDDHNAEWVVMRWPLAAVFRLYADDMRVEILDFLDVTDLDPTELT